MTFHLILNMILRAEIKIAYRKISLVEAVSHQY